MPGGFHGAGMVVVADPGDGLVRCKAIEDGQCGQCSSCATDAAAAGDFDAFTVLSTAVGLVQGVESVGAIAGNPEVGPADVAVRPGRHQATAEKESEVRWADSVNRTPAAHSGTGGKGDQSGVVQPRGVGHRLAAARGQCLGGGKGANRARRWSARRRSAESARGTTRFWRASATKSGSPFHHPWRPAIVGRTRPQGSQVRRPEPRRWQVAW